VDFLAYVKETGPFSTPLVLALGYALRWMNARLEATETRERAAVAEKAALQLEMKQVYADTGRLIERSFESVDEKLDAQSEKLDRLAKP
jgi:hypothetical protein